MAVDPAKVMRILEWPIPHHIRPAMLDRQALGVSFDVIYKPGPDSKAVDALLRMYEEGELRAYVSSPICLQDQDLKREVQNDPILKQIIWILYKIQAPDLGSVGGRAFYSTRTDLSSHPNAIPLLLEEFHPSPGLVGGHSGFLRTYRRIAWNLYWLGNGNEKDYSRVCCL